jgi:hypothetical protein
MREKGGKVVGEGESGWVLGKKVWTKGQREERTERLRDGEKRGSGEVWLVRTSGGMLRNARKSSTSCGLLESSCVHECDWQRQLLISANASLASNRSGTRRGLTFTRQKKQAKMWTKKARMAMIMTSLITVGPIMYAISSLATLWR